MRVSVRKDHGRLDILNEWVRKGCPKRVGKFRVVPSHPEPTKLDLILRDKRFENGCPERMVVHGSTPINGRMWDYHLLSGVSKFADIGGFLVSEAEYGTRPANGGEIHPSLPITPAPADLICEGCKENPQDCTEGKCPIFAYRGKEIPPFVLGNYCTCCGYGDSKCPSKVCPIQSSRKKSVTSPKAQSGAKCSLILKDLQEQKGPNSPQQVSTLIPPGGLRWTPKHGLRLTGSSPIS
jgi:hypothetical protein